MHISNNLGRCLDTVCGGNKAGLVYGNGLA
mgnify:CR=1 FL=1